MKNTIIAVFSAMMMLPVFGTVVVSVNEGESARAMIQKAIDELPKEGGSIFIPAGRYELDGMVHINRSNVTLRGETGTLLVLGDAVKQPNILIGSDAAHPDPKKKIKHIRIANLELDGNKDRQDSEYHPTKPWLRNNTIDIRGVDDLRVENVDCHHARSGGIVASWGCERIWIRGSSFHHNFFDGIALYTSDGIMVSDFYCYENKSAGLSLDNKLKNVTFTNGHIYKNNDCAIFARDCTAVNFRNLNIHDNGEHGAFLAHQVYPEGHKEENQIVPDSGMHDCSFTSCSFTNNGGHGVCFSSSSKMSSGNSIIGCLFSHNKESAVSNVEEGFLVQSGNIEQKKGDYRPNKKTPAKGQ
ncbi:MAG: right-handed parallel beta-helix repeat-containing protein [Akkermansiaceae bacterium]